MEDFYLGSVNIDKMLRDLDKLEQNFCDKYECGHFSCPVCANCCYGDECAIAMVREAIENLKVKK